MQNTNQGKEYFKIYTTRDQNFLIFSHSMFFFFPPKIKKFKACNGKQTSGKWKEKKEGRKNPSVMTGDNIKGSYNPYPGIMSKRCVNWTNP